MKPQFSIFTMMAVTTGVALVAMAIKEMTTGSAAMLLILLDVAVGYITYFYLVFAADNPGHDITKELRPLVLRLVIFAAGVTIFGGGMVMVY